MPANLARFGRPVVFLLLGCLIVYWLLLFAGTHVPKSLESVLHANDKMLHFAGYLGLAFLLVVWRQLGRRLSWQVLATSLAIVALYGACDEITQIPVGRDCELKDWMADVLGAASGTLLAAGAIASYRRLTAAAPSLANKNRS